MPKSLCFPEKRREANFIYVLEYMLSLVRLDKMQNISTLMRKNVLKRLSFGSKDCTKELKLECAYFLGQTS